MLVFTFVDSSEKNEPFTFKANIFEENCTICVSFDDPILQDVLKIKPSDSLSEEISKRVAGYIKKHPLTLNKYDRFTVLSTSDGWYNGGTLLKSIDEKQYELNILSESISIDNNTRFGIVVNGTNIQTSYSGLTIDDLKSLSISERVEPTKCKRLNDFVNLYRDELCEMLNYNRSSSLNNLPPQLINLLHNALPVIERVSDFYDFRIGFNKRNKKFRIYYRNNMKTKSLPKSFGFINERLDSVYAESHKFRIYYRNNSKTKSLPKSFGFINERLEHVYAETHKFIKLDKI